MLLIIGEFSLFFCSLLRVEVSCEMKKSKTVLIWFSSNLTRQLLCCQIAGRIKLLYVIFVGYQSVLLFFKYLISLPIEV